MTDLNNGKGRRKRLINRLTKEHRHATKKTGLPPGSVVYVGDKSTSEFTLEVIEYNEPELLGQTLKDIEECAPFINNERNTWINAVGIDHIDELKKAGNFFGLHILLLEDIANTQHRPKMEKYDEHLFVTLKMLSMSKGNDKEILQEQISFVLSSKWLISFQEQQGDVFDALRLRLGEPSSQLRKKEIDYLFYRLIDTIIDNYFLITEHISDTIETLEEELIVNINNDIRWRIQSLRKDLIQIRKAVSPLREVIGNLTKEENPFIRKNTRRFLFDVYEHILQLNEYIDTQRDLLSSLSELYNSGISNRMNQVMMVLTVMSSIFIPLTFIAGIYGMNFENMPELKWEYGYYGVWVIIIGIAATMLFLFRKKKWL